MTESEKNRDQLFASRTESLDKEWKESEKKADRFVAIRSVLFVLTAVSWVLYFMDRQRVYAAFIGGAFLLLFVVAVVLHTKYKSLIRRLECLSKIHTCYVDRLSHDFSHISDDGSDFLDSSHDYSADLDLFGAGSLFHFLHVGSTWHGRVAFADLLRNVNEKTVDVSEVYRRQDAVRELSGNLEFMQEFQCKAALSGQKGQDPSALLAYAKGGENVSGLKGWILPIFGLITLCFWVSGILAYGYGLLPPVVFLSLFAVQVAVTAFFYGRQREMLASVNDFYKELSAYTSLFDSLEQGEFKAAALVDIQKVFLSDGSKENTASFRNRRLRSLARMIHLRSQPLFFLLLNILFMYDQYCSFYLEKWQKRNGAELEKYLKGVGDFEALMSLSTLSLVNPADVFPVFSEAGDTPLKITAKNLGHPLIPINKVIRNDLSMDRNIVLITGSNMSGKTTFLRTIGINMVLAYAGACCCAAEITIPVMRIATSMRIADNLGEGLSTFYAELVRVGNIIKKSQEKEPLLFLIDEIFRGTNSKDRTDGALLVLERLSSPLILGFMSTHDYALCQASELESMSVAPYHFSEYYNDEGIFFDYRLSPGVSMSSNARYLMQLMGI